MIRLDRLAVLYSKMREASTDRCRFPFMHGRGKFDVVFFSDLIPYRLMFGVIGHRKCFFVEVDEDFRVPTFLDSETYYILCDALGLRPNPDNRFRPASFFQDLNRKLPKQLGQKNEVEPEHILKYRQDAKESDKRYFWFWRLHMDSTKSSVTKANLEKTRLLLGEEAYKQCKTYIISSVWTNMRGRKNKDWKKALDSIVQSRARKCNADD